MSRRSKGNGVVLSNSFSYDEVRRLLEMFARLDQSRDVSTYINSKPIVSLRGKFQRMRDKHDGVEGGDGGES